MTATSEYEAAVHARGWVFLLQLPANTPLGKSVGGAPGARSPWTPKGSTYELAPAAVLQEQAFFASPFHEPGITDDTIVSHARDVVTSLTEATGLDHGAGGLVAKVLGIPPWMLLVVLLVVGYAMLRQYRLVPPFKKVFV